MLVSIVVVSLYAGILQGMVTVDVGRDNMRATLVEIVAIAHAGSSHDLFLDHIAESLFGLLQARTSWGTN